MEGIYVDHAATSFCRPEVWDAMRSYSLNEFANPSSIHSPGKAARLAVDQAREAITASLGVTSGTIVFTSGGSESNNLAVRGAALADGRKGRHIVTTRAEHHSILQSCEELKREGFAVTYLEVDRYGKVDPQQVSAAIREDTSLVSVMHANNEVGTIQPIADIARNVKERRPDIVLHTDAVQTIGHVPVDVASLGVDLVSFTAHKFYGPMGIGGLYVGRDLRLRPQITGGGQEGRLRAGTESVPLIVGMAKALKLAVAEMESEQAWCTATRDRICTGLLARIEDSRLNGHATERLPNNVNVSFLGISGEDLVLLLDRIEIYASTGSACSTGSVNPSHVLTALGLSRAWALGSLRLTLGHGCRSLNCDHLIENLSKFVAELRSTNYVTSICRPTASLRRRETVALGRRASGNHAT